MRKIDKYKYKNNVFAACGVCFIFVSTVMTVSPNAAAVDGFEYYDSFSKSLKRKIIEVPSVILNRPVPGPVTEDMGLVFDDSAMKMSVSADNGRELIKLENAEEHEQELKSVLTSVKQQMHRANNPYWYMEEPVVYPGSGHLTRTRGVFKGPSGRETYYNLEMREVVARMRRMGFSEKEYPYWVRSDGVKMLGRYVMVAANLKIRPRGSTLMCSLGEAIVCDTGGFVKHYPKGLDIAVDW